MAKSCKTCEHFDLEAARLGGKNVKSHAMVNCYLPLDLIKIKTLPSLPYCLRSDMQALDSLYTCADYGSDCDYWVKRAKPIASPSKGDAL